ncbi:MAG: hypothetical protein M3P48_08510 [Actinomycetota bacterium]|nr:hypothetical protein [Actinomycetota bacterium]
MRRLLPAVALAGALLLAAGVVWSYAERAARVHPGVTLVLALGTVVALASIAGMVVVERRPGALRVPSGARLPAPDTTWALLGVGLSDTVAGAFASWPAGFGGVVLVGIAAVVAGLRLSAAQDGVTDSTSDQSVPTGSSIDRPTVVAARRIVAFARAHGAAGKDGQGVDAEIQHMGRDLARVVLVAPDGTLGDVVVKGQQRARRAAELSGADLHEQLPGEVTARVHSTAYEWRRMAGQQLDRR